MGQNKLIMRCDSGGQIEIESQLKARLLVWTVNGKAFPPDRFSLTLHRGRKRKVLLFGSQLSEAWPRCVKRRMETYSLF